MPRINFAVLILIQLLCLPLEFAAQSQIKETKRGTATVSGQALLNGAPLGDVTVILRLERPTSAEEAKGYQTQSDNDGNYRIAGIAAGHYFISVRTPGFVTTGVLESGSQGKILEIAAGEKLENIDLELKREGVITGRVTDSNGDPVVREWVELIKLGDDGKPQPSPFNYPGLKFTDERGVYRITGLPEGRYLVSVGVSQEESAGRPQYRNSSYPKTFHPGVADPSQANAVVVKEGFETTDVNISGVAVKKTYEISGRVVYADTGRPAEGVTILYGAIIGDRGVTSGWRPSREPSNSEGEFQIQGFVPDKYAIYAYTPPKRELFSDPVIYEVTDSAIQGVELRIHRGGSISGAVPLNESPPRTMGANVDARGQFIIENLLPGEYEARLISMIYQPGEPRDKGLSKLISSVRQKVSVGGVNQAPITLVVDLSQKEGNR